MERYRYKYKRICVPAGPTMVWKKDKYGRLRATEVRRKAYCRWIKVRIRYF